MLVLLIITWFDWQTIKTDNFTIIYKPGYEWEAKQALYNLEYYKESVWQLTGNNYRHLPVVIEDPGLLTNGYANPVFRNVHIFTHPPNPGIQIDATMNWYRHVTIHEYTHICHLTNATGMAKVFNFVLGFPSLPNIYSPLWLMEGITVYSESKEMYEGRLNDGYFDAYIGTRKDNLPSLPNITNTPAEFPYYLGPYLYGGEFFQFLAENYGEDRFAHLFNTYGSYFWAPIGAIFPFIGVDLAADNVYGKGLPNLYADWQESVKLKYSNWQIDGTRLTSHGWYKSYLTIYKDELYYYQQYPRKIDALKTKNFYQIVQLDPELGNRRVIAELISPLTCAIRIDDNNLYYARLAIKRGMPNVYLGGFGYTSEIHVIDLETLKNRKIFSDDIRGFAVFSDGRIIYAKDKKHTFGSELWIYTDGKKKKVWDTDYLIGEICIDKARIAVTARKDFSTWSIFLLDLNSKRIRPLVNSPWVEANISLQGNILVYTSNHYKRYAIYYYDFEQDQTYRLTSNGYANYGAAYNENLYFLGLNKEGIDIYKKSLHPRIFFPEAGSNTATPDFNNLSLEISTGGYLDVFKTLLQPALHVPVAVPMDSTYKKWLLGAALMGADATDENIYATFIGYDQPDEEFVLHALLLSKFFSPVNLDLQYLHKATFQTNLSYPVYRATGPGLSRFSLLLTGTAFDDLKRRELSPGLELGFSYPKFRSDMRFFVDWEDSTFSSSNRLGKGLDLKFNYYLAGGELRMLCGGYHDPDNPDSLRVKIRGNDLYTKTGGRLSFEYAHPILKIRRGLWNPNIFFEDLCGQIFFDLGVAEDGDYIWSTGMELKFETGVALGYIRFAPKIGLALTGDKETRQKQVKFFWSII